MKRLYWWWRNMEIKPEINWGQWIVGLQFEYGRIIPTRWVVLHVGPVSVAVSVGRRMT